MDAPAPPIDIKSALTGYAHGDPPLLQELGINFHTILQECRLLFTPTPTPDSTTDLTGPLIIVFLFSSILLLAGKILFGCVYFLSVLFTLAVHRLVNMMGEGEMEYVAVCSVMGYAFLPMCGFVGVWVVAGYLVGESVAVCLGAGCSFYGAWICAEVFVECLRMREKKWMVLYSVFLVYMSFVVLALY